VLLLLLLGVRVVVVEEEEEEESLPLDVSVDMPLWISASGQPFADHS
jgi:hypothetical protein